MKDDALHDDYVGRIMQGFCSNPAIFARNSQSGWSLVNCTNEALVDYARELATDMLKVRAAGLERSAGPQESTEDK